MIARISILVVAVLLFAAGIWAKIGGTEWHPWLWGGALFLLGSLLGEQTWKLSKTVYATLPGLLFLLFTGFYLDNIGVDEYSNYFLALGSFTFLFGGISFISREKQLRKGGQEPEPAVKWILRISAIAFFLIFLYELSFPMRELLPFDWRERIFPEMIFNRFIFRFAYLGTLAFLLVSDILNLVPPKKYYREYIIINVALLVINLLFFLNFIWR